MNSCETRTNSYYTVEEAAAILRISKNTAYEWVRAGVLKSLRCGRTIRIPPSALETVA